MYGDVFSKDVALKDVKAGMNFLPYKTSELSNAVECVAYCLCYVILNQELTIQFARSQISRVLFKDSFFAWSWTS